MKQFNVIPAEAGIHCYLARRSQGIGMSKQPAVYILSNKRNGTLYIGVTSNLIQRVWQHKNNLTPGFSQKYNLHRLIYFELFENMEVAIQYEKQLKKWHRKWKIELIENTNPEWNDLYLEIV